jgi:hypothetical protein
MRYPAGAVSVDLHKTPGRKGGEKQCGAVRKSGESTLPPFQIIYSEKILEPLCCFMLENE